MPPGMGMPPGMPGMPPGGMPPMGGGMMPPDMIGLPGAMPPMQGPFDNLSQEELLLLLGQLGMETAPMMGQGVPGQPMNPMILQALMGQMAPAPMG